MSDDLKNRYQEIPVALKVPSQWEELKHVFASILKDRRMKIKAESAREQALIEEWRKVATEKMEALRLKLSKKQPSPAKPPRKPLFSWKRRPGLPTEPTVFLLNQSHADLL